MARVITVKKAQQRYRTVPVIDPATGQQKITPVLRKNGEPRLTKAGRAVTMRVTIEDKTQPLPNRKCDKCGTEITVGSPYKWTKTKGAYGGTKRVRCAACPSWTYQELSSSWAARISAVTDAFAGFDGDSVEDAQALLEDFAQQIRDLAEESRETAENVREGFGHDTHVSENADQRADDLDGWADEIESTDLTELPEPEASDCDTCQGTGKVEGTEQDEDGTTPDVDCDECGGSGEVENDDPTDEQMDEWRETVTSEIEDVLNNCPV